MLFALPDSALEGIRLTSIIVLPYLEFSNSPLAACQLYRRVTKSDSSKLLGTKLLALDELESFSFEPYNSRGCYVRFYSLKRCKVTVKEKTTNGGGQRSLRLTRACRGPRCSLEPSGVLLRREEEPN